MNSDDQKQSAWVIQPVDDEEKMLAASIDFDEVNGREPNYAFDVDECGGCKCDLSTRAYSGPCRPPVPEHAGP